MKKIMLLFVLVLTLLITGCSRQLGGLNDISYGKIDYQVCGLYIAPVFEDQKPKLEMSDNNPKVYFKYGENIRFSTSTGNGDAYVQYTNQSDAVNKSSDGTTIELNGNANLNFLNKDIKKVALYPIIYKDGRYQIDTNHFDLMDNNSRYNYDTKFIFNKIKYNLHISLIFN